MNDDPRRQIADAMYRMSTLAVFFHSLVARRFGLRPTEEKAMLILGGEGPMTAGELSERTGLTTAAATSLIDRLEASGSARRERHPTDRRKVIVVPDAKRLAELREAYAELGVGFDDLLDRYGPKELGAMADFLTSVADRATEAVRRGRREAAAPGGSLPPPDASV